MRLRVSRRLDLPRAGEEAEVSLDPDFRLIDSHAHLFSTDGWDHIRIVQDRIGAEATNLACLPAWKKEFLAHNGGRCP